MISAATARPCTLAAAHSERSEPLRGAQLVPNVYMRAELIARFSLSQAEQSGVRLAQICGIHFYSSPCRL